MTTSGAHFDELFEQTLAHCDELSRSDALHFIEHGYVTVKNAFSKEIADAIRENAWNKLAETHGVDRDDPTTWSESSKSPHAIPGYYRTAGGRERLNLSESAPKALQAQADVVGGLARLPAKGIDLVWSHNAIANLGSGSILEPQEPQARLPGWHKDGWHFRHFLDSPEQGLLAVPIYSDILPQSGGTFLATDSIAPVAQLLAGLPKGIHPDAVQGAGYLIPGLVEECQMFRELTASAGDLVLIHPYMLHRVSLNPSPRPRFIANTVLVLADEMCFAREDGDVYSLVELATLKALGAESCDYRVESHREAFTPFPFRDDETKATERLRLEAEMRSFAEQGVVTPEWGPEFGYMTNHQFQ